MNLKTKNILLLPALALTLVACEKDEDKVYLNSIEPGELIASYEEELCVSVSLVQWKDRN